MSSNTNQASGTANQQAMAALQALYGPTTSTTTKEVKKSFIGTKKPAEQSDEVAAVEDLDNPPLKNNQE